MKNETTNIFLPSAMQSTMNKTSSSTATIILVWENDVFSFIVVFSHKNILISETSAVWSKNKKY